VRNHVSGRVPRSLGVAPDNHPTPPLGRPRRSGAPDALPVAGARGDSPMGPSEGWPGGVVRGEPRRGVTPSAQRERPRPAQEPW